MKVQPKAAWRAVFFNTIFLTICLLLIPAIGQAKAKTTAGFEKKDLVTTADFIEYAEETECDIHDLFFSMRPYEGTKSCLMCQITFFALTHFGNNQAINFSGNRNIESE